MSGTIVKQSNDEYYIPENAISLKQFPPVLRDLGKYLLESDKPVSYTQACKELNLNRDSVYTTINRVRRKGLDFQKFIDEQSSMILNQSKVGVFRALVEGAVSDSHMDRKLYFQLTGDLKESTNINVGSLTIGININALPVDPGRDKGIIDVEPFIPKK